MKQQKMHSFLLWSLFFNLMAWTALSHAAQLTETGAWSQRINDTNLSAGAGSDLQSSIQNPLSQVTLAVTNTLGASWTVSASNSNITLPANVFLSVMRGSTSCTISGGTTWIAINGANQTFFMGTGDCASIPIQIQEQALSVRHGTGSFSSNVTFTIQ